MNRRQMIEFVNEQVLPGAEIADGEWLQYGREIVLDIVKAISRWRIGKQANIHMNCKVLDGVLYINGDAIARVASKLPRVQVNDAEYYWEGRCIL